MLELKYDNYNDTDIFQHLCKQNAFRLTVVLMFPD